MYEDAPNYIKNESQSTQRKKDQQEGEAAIKGAKVGEGRTLSSVEEGTVQQLMPELFSDELNIDNAL